MGTINKSGITVKALLSLLPLTILEKTAAQSHVNKHVKKLSGELMFQLLLMGILNSERLSLRLMEDLYKNRQFQIYTGLPSGSKTKHTSLSDRLMNIECSFFQQMYQHTFDQLSSHFPATEIKKRLIHRYDSTSISASAKLLESGMFNGLVNKKSGEHRLWQIKATIGFDGLYPRSVKLYKEQKYLSEDLALGECIKEHIHSKDSIIVFDRGLKNRTTFADFSKAGKAFITRINSTENYRVIKKLNTTIKAAESETLVFISDEEILFDKCNRKNKPKTAFRLIKTRNKQNQEIILFLTNINDLKAQDIALIYKSRWDIEVFFRFLKQELNFKHFTSYSFNGIQVMMYMTLIAAMLIMIYKKINNIDGYKRAKRLFMEGLDTEITRTVVIFCGGDPDKHPLLNST